MAPAILLPTRMVEKPWGVTHLPAPFAPQDARVGEVWFEPPAELPELLVKYIYTSDKLSVQVHPDDAQAMAAGLGRQGKEECWLVIAAEPGAKLGIGFRRDVGADAMRTAALDGSIEGLMAWHDVAPGDFFYIPAGTVHAIGGGVSLVEIQQNSDVTYRLFDYGRLDGGVPRELHLDAAVAAARGEVYDGARWHQRLAGDQAAALVDGPYFRLDRAVGAVGLDLRVRYAGAPLLLVPLAGEARVGARVVAPGACALVMDVADVALDSLGACLLAQATGGMVGTNAPAV